VPDNIKIVFKEDFEYSNIKFITTDISSVDIVRTDLLGEVYEKKYSLKATLKNDNDFLEFMTEDDYKLPRNKAIYLEANFKTDIKVSFGYIAIGYTNAVQRYFFEFNPTDEWKKIYINLGNEIQFESTDKQYFKLLFKALKTDNSDSAQVFFDNIKLIHVE